MCDNSGIVFGGIEDLLTLLKLTLQSLAMERSKPLVKLLLQNLKLLVSKLSEPTLLELIPVYFTPEHFLYMLYSESFP